MKWLSRHMETAVLNRITQTLLLNINVKWHVTKLTHPSPVFEVKHTHTHRMKCVEFNECTVMNPLSSQSKNQSCAVGKVIKSMTELGRSLLKLTCRMFDVFSLQISVILFDFSNK